MTTGHLGHVYAAFKQNVQSYAVMFRAVVGVGDAVNHRSPIIGPGGGPAVQRGAGLTVKQEAQVGAQAIVQHVVQ